MNTKKTTSELVQERPSVDEVAELNRHPINIVADNIRSLDNVGLLFRLCDLALINKLYLTGYTGHPRVREDEREESVIVRHESRIFKTAVYALPVQPWEYVKDAEELILSLKSEGHNIIALEQTTNSVAYNKVSAEEYRTPLTLIIGHERQGISDNLLGLADQVIEIPVHGHGNSHNVALASSIVLYHILEKNGLI